MNEERDRRIRNAFRRALVHDGDEHAWWWLSFCDTTRPEGSQFLGGCLVAAPTFEVAVARSHLLRINPGGEVAGLGPIPVDQIPDHQPRHQLLSREEIEGPT